ncbi:hypothetical protein [Sphingobium yanoikuyae]|jgi:hypothetical protein|uniref:hypothetical protein n=1 Tax=Sphingobium yanoikuyae TaxID=13690 RepID=UPI001479643B|nr:hypothetical protein [Sphingobium yanoikuyae]|tara:strand:- start:5607 stop:5765 length:159 start_codon:yes stop_codon:yes gene_type:complete
MASPVDAIRSGLRNGLPDILQDGTNGANGGKQQRRNGIEGNCPQQLTFKLQV